MRDQSDAFAAGVRAALVVAHPGHELRVHGWLELVRPTVFVLTDGSGAHGQSRLDSTSRVLDRVGARRGAIYGAVSDRDLYKTVLAGDASWFVALASALLDALLAAEVQVVAADAREGFNPAHDLCRHVVDAVVARARRQGRRLASFAFPLDAAPGGTDGRLPHGCIRTELSEAAYARKLAAAQSYAGLDAEVRAALSTHGADAFRYEVFWPSDEGSSPSDDPPAYERFGEQRQTTGVYGEVIRRHAHIEPLARALRRFAEESDSGVIAGHDSHLARVTSSRTR